MSEFSWVGETRRASTPNAGILIFAAYIQLPPILISLLFGTTFCDQVIVCASASSEEGGSCFNISFI